jgi:hypothetical protein
MSFLSDGKTSLDMVAMTANENKSTIYYADKRSNSIYAVNYNTWPEEAPKLITTCMSLIVLYLKLHSTFS